MLPKLSLRIRSWTNNNKNLSTMSPASRVEFSFKTLSYHSEEFSVISKKCCSFHFAFSNECWFANPISPLNDLGESFKVLSPECDTLSIFSQMMHDIEIFLQCIITWSVYFWSNVPRLMCQLGKVSRTFLRNLSRNGVPPPPSLCGILVPEKFTD